MRAGVGVSHSGAAMIKLTTIAFSVALAFPASALVASSDGDEACARISSAFAKIWTATIRCRFPKTDEMARPIAAVYLAAERACGGVSQEKWTGARSGEAAFEDEVGKKGQDAVCKRIRDELIAAGRNSHSQSR
jgi:hypothetical protein